MPTMAARKALLVVAAILVGYAATAVSADGHARHPNLIERIMEPIVRQVHLSQIGGPMKQPLLDGSHLSFRKLNMESSAQGDTASEQSDNNAKDQPGNDVANSDNTKSKEAPGSGSNSHEASHRNPAPASSVVIVQSSGLPEPPPASFHSAHPAPGPFDLMQHFLNSFMAAPPVMNPDFVPPPPLLPIVAAAETAKKASEKDNSSDANGVEVISVDVEVFVVPNANGNATASGKNNATASAGSSAARSPLFPRIFGLHLNRSAFRAVDIPHANTSAGAERQAAVPSREPLQNGAAKQQVPDGPVWGQVSSLGIVLLTLLVLACILSCALGVVFTITWRKRRLQRGAGSTSFWITKTGKLKLRRAGERGEVIVPVSRIGDSWRA